MIGSVEATRARGAAEVAGEGASEKASGVGATASPERRLREIPLRREVELVRIDLPTDAMVPLLERGLIPGCRLCPLRKSPTGDPILLVDGQVLALRREMAECLCVRDAELLSD